jgi:hypothetical protein
MMFPKNAFNSHHPIASSSHFAEMPLVTRILSKGSSDLNENVLQQMHLTAQEELSSTESWWLYEEVVLSICLSRSLHAAHSLTPTITQEP